MHAHLILWDGDILYLYGICGMLVYLFRNVRPHYLVLGVQLVAAFDFGTNTLLYQLVRAERIAYVDASAAAAAGKELTPEQSKAIDDWREIEKSFLPNRADAEENTRQMKSDYATVAKPLWLRYFLYGPLEWLWWSLTYWRWQPFRRQDQSPLPDSGTGVSGQRFHVPG